MSEEETFAIGVPGLEDEPVHRRPWWLPLLHLFAVIGGFVGPLVWLIPSFIHPHTGGQLTACKSNCKNLATALEMYASDNQGKYPRSLEQLTQGYYLKKLPTCPGADEMTYTNYRVSQSPDSFSFACVGDNHARAYQGLNKPSRNYPRYNSNEGLIDHP